MSGLLTGASGGRAEIRLAALFRDGAVLQRDKPVPIWGSAIAREEIRVQFGGQTTETVADEQGRWQVTLAPLAASATPAELKVTGSQSKAVRVTNVLVGEVWLCAGQSNMGFRVSRSLKAKADAAALRYPLIRQFDVPTLSADEPRTEIESTWIETLPETVRMFTAVGFYFALEVHRALGVPVGFIRAAPGGTRIEAWMSPAALASDPAFAAVGESWRVSVAGYNVRRAANEKARADWATAAAAAKAAGVAFAKPQPAELPGLGLAAPSGLFHGMIHPLLPYALHARAKVYGETIACESPRALGFENAGNGLRVRFSEAAGLYLRDGKSGGAEIAGADRVFHPAAIRVEGDSVVLASPAVPAPVAVRYAWSNAPETCLYNGAGLPVAPFRSDDW
jgi:sialate O-acetylesterase